MRRRRERDRPEDEAAAKAGYARLGHVASDYTGAQFTRAATLKRTPNDWGYYVHSHGDYYLNTGDARRYRASARTRRLQPGGRLLEGHQGEATRPPSNLVFVSTCHAADANTTLPGAFAIARRNRPARQPGPEFYVGYIGSSGTPTNGPSSSASGTRCAGRKSVGSAFDMASLGNFIDRLRCRLVGHLHWSGAAGPVGRLHDWS